MDSKTTEGIVRTIRIRNPNGRIREFKGEVSKEEDGALFIKVIAERVIIPPPQ